MTQASRPSSPKHQLHLVRHDGNIVRPSCTRFERQGCHCYRRRVRRRWHRQVPLLLLQRFELIVKGNGRAFSIMFADEGCNVLCLDLNLDWAQKTAEIASSRPGRGEVIALKADVTKAADCEAAVQTALKEFGKVDILVNNVGIGGAPGTAIEVDMDAWAKGLEINISTMVQMAKYAIPAMLKNEGELKGSVINMGSVAGLKGGTPHLLYPTSKGAVVNMTRAMSAHHAPHIRVNCVCPGVSSN